VAAVILPFEGLSPAWEALFSVCLAVVFGMFIWSAVLFVRALSAARLAPPAPAGGAEEFTWVFLVPALDEEVTIRDSVERLLSLELSRRRVIVIDDASEDRTAEVLAGISHPDLAVLARTLPNARQGKAAALNYAYRSLGELDDRERTIVVIVDADGRLDAGAPRFAASQFESDPAVGGVQSLVRIYNRRHFLTWLQDLEFSVYGYLSRPVATTGALLAWAATGSSTGSVPSMTSPTTPGRGGIALPRTRTSACA
jgi:1,2-diacylglycerol 3-beta-glucosyltransferase